MNETDIVKEHSLAYIVYAIGLHLIDSDKDFDKDSIDDEWNTRVLPWAKEFYYSKEYNDENRPLMDCLNEWVEKKLEDERQKIYNVPIRIIVDTTVPVLASDINQMHKNIAYNLKDILKEVSDEEIEWDYNGDEKEINRKDWDKKEDVLTEDGWSPLMI